MTTEELREEIVSGCDRVLNSPIAHRFMSEQQERIIRAERDFWRADDGTQLSKLLELFGREPSR
jgi:hypothetical protein